MGVSPFCADTQSARCDDNDNDNIMTQNILMVDGCQILSGMGLMVLAQTQASPSSVTSDELINIFVYLVHSTPQKTAKQRSVDEDCAECVACQSRDLKSCLKQTNTQQLK